MNREILRLAVPNILSNISVPLLSTVDTMLMGRESAAHLGAVGLGAMIFNFIYWNFGFLRMGTTGLTAQAYGRKDDLESGRVLGRALLVAVLVAGLLVALQRPLGMLSFWLLAAQPEVQPLVSTYFFTRIWAAPATLGLYAFLGWFFGMQNAVLPLVLTILINVVNIALSVVLVRIWGWGVYGVALGTVLAQYAGLLLAVLFISWRYRSYSRGLVDRLVLQKEALIRFLRLNGDILLRTFCLTLAFGFFYSRSSAYGELVLAANVILLQYLNWMSYGIDGFAFAAESLVGKYAGAGEDAQTRKAIRYAFAWGMGLAVLYSLIYGFFGEALLYVFSDEQAVVRTTVPFLFWMVLFPLLGTPCYLWDGVFIGLTATRAMRNSMLLALLIYLGVYALAAPHGQNHGLWLALLVFLVARGVVQGLWYAGKGLSLR